MVDRGDGRFFCDGQLLLWDIAELFRSAAYQHTGLEAEFAYRLKEVDGADGIHLHVGGRMRP